jgi:hypothetical protein
MKEPGIGRDQALIAHDEASEVPQPGKGPLHDPPPPIAAHLTPILVGGSAVSAAGRDNGLDAPPGQPGAQGVAVIAAIRNQALGPPARPPRLARPADGDRVEGPLEEPDRCRGCRVQGCSQRSTRAIDQNQPLDPLAACSRPDLRSPCFAGTKLPSAKHSSQRIFCWSLS